MPSATLTKRKREASPQDIVSAWEDQATYHYALRDDPALWSEIVAGIAPHAGQRRLLSLPLDEPGKVFVIDWARQLGKSTGLAVWLSWKCFSQHGYRAFIMAPGQRQSSLLFDKCLSILDHSEYISSYVPYKVKSDTITIAGDDWDSTIRLLRTGLKGDHARGPSTSGAGVLCYDEVGSFQYLPTVRSATNPIAASGGSEIYLGSPGWCGSDWHEWYTFVCEQQAKALAVGKEPTYYHVPCKWQETDHIRPDWVLQKREEHESLGTLPEFQREILGEWVSPSSRFFPDELIGRCVQPHIAPLKRADRVLASLDIGGAHSCTVILLGRYSPAARRIEVTDYYSFVFESNRYVDKSRHTVIEDHTQLLDVASELRLQYGNPIYCSYDPGNQEAIPQLLEQQGFNMEAVRVSSYPAKITFLKDLTAAMGEGRIVWSDPEITKQLQLFCPTISKTTGKYEFPDGGMGYDIICCLGQLVRFLGGERRTPWAIRRCKQWE